MAFLLPLNLSLSTRQYPSQDLGSSISRITSVAVLTLTHAGHPAHARRLCLPIETPHMAQPFFWMEVFSLLTTSEWSLASMFFLSEKIRLTNSKAASGLKMRCGRAISADEYRGVIFVICNALTPSYPILFEKKPYHLGPLLPFQFLETKPN